MDTQEIVLSKFTNNQKGYRSLTIILFKQTESNGKVTYIIRERVEEDIARAIFSSKSFVETQDKYMQKFRLLTRNLVG